MYEIKSIGEDAYKLNPPMFSLRYENGELKSISVNCRNLNAHFQTEQWCYDFHRYIQLSKKELKEIEALLLENEDDWGVLNSVYDRLFELRNKYYERVLDEDGVLKDKFYHYEVIAYHCCPNVKRSLKTVSYVNQMIGVYANCL